ncbi:MAG: family 78 glycoside hydrolase catalytic domain [Christensenellales bacterium]|jgi:alpha-L-rhamnosidase
MQRIWNAKWITDHRFAELQPMNVFHKELQPLSWKPDPKLENSHLLFRRSFNATKGMRATLYISADDYYKLYINGQFVDQGPAPGNPQHYYYNTIDISHFLRTGRNVIAVHTYYQGVINRVWVSGDQRHGLIAELVLNGITALGTDESWKVAPHTGYRSLGMVGYKTQFLEEYDSAASETTFEEPDFDDSAWNNASLRQHVDYGLYAQPVEQLNIYRIKPVIVRYDGDLIHLDFGQAIVGYFEACAQGVKGSAIIIRTGQELLENNRVRFDMRANCRYEEKWLLSGGTDTLRQYDYKPFRYIELQLPNGATVEDASLCAIVRHYPYQEVLKPQEMDEKLERVFRLCANTIKYGVQDKYMDSLDREKGQYLGDEAFASYAHMLLTGDIALPRKFLRDAAETVTICKGMMSESVCSFSQEIADYSLQFAGDVYRHYLYTRDKGILCEMLPVIMGIAEYFQAHERSDGLIENVTEKWNLVDWPANMRDDYDFELSIPIGKGCHNVINGYYIGMWRDIDRILEALGMTTTGRADQLVQAYIQAFYDEERGLFRDSETSQHISQHGNILPLAFDIGLDERTKNNILNLMREKRWTCNVYIGMYLIYGLMRMGEKELLHELLVDENAWLRMLSEDATVTFEAWYKDQKWNTSLFHMAGTVPIIALGGHW